MRRFFVLALVLVIVTGMFGFQIVLKATTPFQEGHILAETMKKFKEKIEAATSGTIVVELQAGVVSEEEANNQCSKGIVDMQFTGGRPVEVFAPEYFFVNAPFVIQDYEHFLRVWNGPIGEKAKTMIAEKGNMVCLGTVYRGYRQMTANKPIRGPEDIKGLKLRLPVVPTWVKIWEAIGVTAVPVPLTELYQALKEGRAEASEGDVTQISSFKLYEVQSYLIITNHQCGVGWITMNKAAYERLTVEERKLVHQIMNEVCAWATEKLKASEGDIIKFLQEKGMKLIKLDEAALKAIRDLAAPAVEELFKTTWPATTWAEVLRQ